MIKEFLDHFDYKSIHDSDSCGDTPLYYAVFRKELEIAKELIELGVDVNKKCEFGVTPIYEAIDKSNIPMIKLLLENGARVDIETEIGDTARELAKYINNQEILNLIKEYERQKGDAH
ncbi:ankyrin repeat domain-containing protein [Motiliproteus sp. MSK22-1]|uniref:ankyrin repeat domain-containing protein n=1 Tax=Motiliproteus sp. MSK22-1 TaxID=1897630 RepID=UPI000977CD2C|nr:ankyrin repeat domain-containing protein [Motiliproteus sp. MSK22-1]OMH39308.1 hypothetical protein BGP75_04265 [Motiliproteus sp. MSK22-1]